MTNEDEIYGRLGDLEGHGKIMENRLSAVETSIHAVDLKLDKISEKITVTRGFEPAAVLSFVKDAAVLIAMACASIIYFASQPGEANISAREKMAVMEYKLSILEKQIGWKAITQ